MEYETYKSELAYEREVRGGRGGGEMGGEKRRGRRRECVVVWQCLWKMNIPMQDMTHSYACHDSPTLICVP